MVGLGIEVVEAETAERGLEILGRHGSQAIPIDVVLLDIGLPEMSGLEAFRAYHVLDAKLPVIFVTAMESSDVAIQAMTLGAYDFVMKLLDVEALGKLISQAIEVRRLMNVPVRVSGAASRDHHVDLMVVKPCHAGRLQSRSQSFLFTAPIFPG